MKPCTQRRLKINEKVFLAIKDVFGGISISDVSREQKVPEGSTQSRINRLILLSCPAIWEAGLKLKQTNGYPNAKTPSIHFHLQNRKEILQYVTARMIFDRDYHKAKRHTVADTTLKMVNLEVLPAPVGSLGELHIAPATEPVLSVSIQQTLEALAKEQALKDAMYLLASNGYTLGLNERRNYGSY